MDIQMIGVLWLVGSIVLGLVNCYFGYRLFIVTVGIVGFLLGATLGYLIGVWTGSLIFGLIAAVIFGLIGGWASVMAYYAFIFVAGALAFAFTSAFLAGLYSSEVSALIPIACGLIGGLLALWLQRIIIIIATAMQGAIASTLAVAALASGGGLNAYRTMFYDLMEGTLGRVGSAWFYVGLSVWLILAVSGALYQFRRGKEMYRYDGGSGMPT